MADQTTSVILTPADRKRVAKLRRFLARQYGKVSFAFIVREAFRAMEDKIDAIEKPGAATFMDGTPDVGVAGLSRLLQKKDGRPTQ
jgi:hypothetical protein